MNELLFFTQILLVIGFTFGARKMGRDALVSSAILQAILANLFVTKQIVLFSFHVTASDAFAVGSILSISFLQEDFGKEAALKTTLLTFFAFLFYVLVSSVHQLFTPSPFDQTDAAFQTILSTTPRLLFASITTFFLVQQFDVRFLTFMKNRFPNIAFSTRASLSLLLSQLLDTTLFTFLGLFGLVGAIGDVILVSYLIKLAVISMASSSLRMMKA